MPSLIEPSVLCPVLIGREPVIATLTRALDVVATGQGRMVVLAGEAGVGKSRLVAELKATARERGFGLRQGHCFEPDRALPFAPLLDLLRAFIAAHPLTDVIAALQPFAPELVKLLPELAGLMPGVSPTPALDPEQEKRRLFQTITQFLTSPPTPLLIANNERSGEGGQGGEVLIVEDIHWCDDTSLDFLLALARHSAAHPILLLLTYRDDELHPALRHFLAELDRA
ncbi:MAG: BREX system ATP-binding domain-containing protein, partial [Anaerolineales bacterium]